MGATLSGDQLRAMLGGALPVEGEDPVGVIDTLAEAGLTGTVASQGPRYFGFVTGGSTPAAIAADWLVSTWDQNAQMFVMSPISAVVEQIVSEWLKELFGLPPAWSVGFVTGAQMASFTSLITARHQLLREAGWDVERDGLFGAPAIDVVVGEESHRTIFTALRMLGLGGERVRRVDADGQGRMRPDRLEEMLRGQSVSCARRAATSIPVPRIRSTRLRPLRAGVEPGSTSMRPSVCGRRPVRRGAPSSPASIGPIQSRPTATSGSTSPTTPAWS